MYRIGFNGRVILGSGLLLGLLCTPLSAGALPRIDISLGGDVQGPQQLSETLKIIALLTVLSLAPAILMLMTCFTRIVIVLSFARQALGVQGMPPTQVMVGLALILTAFLMAPVGKRAYEQGLRPYMDGRLAGEQALVTGFAPIRGFMLHHARIKDLELFTDLSADPAPARPADVSSTVLIPAFVLSELTTAFEMGFLIFIPFLLLDLVVASVLMSMGMVMLPPALVAMPLKVMLFVLVDGWHLLVSSLIRSVHA
jgi:flagellar biosynthetic protein FliP